MSDENIYTQFEVTAFGLVAFSLGFSDAMWRHGGESFWLALLRFVCTAGVSIAFLYLFRWCFRRMDRKEEST